MWRYDKLLMILNNWIFSGWFKKSVPQTLTLSCKLKKKKKKIRLKLTFLSVRCWSVASEFFQSADTFSLVITDRSFFYIIFMIMHQIWLLVRDFKVAYIFLSKQADFFECCSIYELLKASSDTNFKKMVCWFALKKQHTDHSVASKVTKSSELHRSVQNQENMLNLMF